VPEVEAKSERDVFVLLGDVLRLTTSPTSFTSTAAAVAASCVWRRRQPRSRSDTSGRSWSRRS